MKLGKTCLFVVVLVGCVQQPISQQPISQQPISQQSISQQSISQQPISQQHVEVKSNSLLEEKKAATKQQIASRIAYLKDQVLLSNLKLENFYEEDSLFGVMKALQDGKLTTSNLTDALFYFKDPVGYDSKDSFDNTYFKCIQVIEWDEVETDSGDKVSRYQALYFNSQIDMTVTVIWYGTRPLKGQKLNVDFLMFVTAGTYKNTQDEDRTEVVFARPLWADSNGFSYD